MPWFTEKYPQYRDRSERELYKFPTGRPDPRYFRSGSVETPVSLNQKLKSSFAERIVKGIEPMPVADFSVSEIMANRIASELERLSRDRQIYAQWRRAEDRRRWSPAGANAWPSNLYGASAQVFSSAKRGMRVFSAGALPCVDRVTRRQVLFAKKKAGRGYKVPHRKTWRSAIPC